MCQSRHIRDTDRENRVSKYLDSFSGRLVSPHIHTLEISHQGDDGRKRWGFLTAITERTGAVPYKGEPVDDGATSADMCL